jgi:hypothetical protein
MIATPFRFEANLTDQEFQTLGRFLTRWSMIEHIIANCLRTLLKMDPKIANIMIFPLTFDLRFKRINQIIEHQPLDDRSAALLAELKPLIAAMQYIRNAAVHGIIIDPEDGSEQHFQLRSKGRNLHKADLWKCEDLINYTAHVTLAFRMSLGDKDGWPEGRPYPLPDRPPLPDFLPAECRKFPQDDKVERASRLEA